MDILYRCCAGLDVHKKTVVACIRRVDARGQAHQEIRTFGTMTCHLLALSDWLAEQGVEHVAMESTGVYWKPVFNILQARLAVMLVNAQHIKQVPGRKTDVKDCAWIAHLLQHGLLRASFVPPPPIRELRDLTRQLAQLIAEKATAANRIQKVLEDANIKLAAVATDVLGVSGRAMLTAMIAGEEDAEQLTTIPGVDQRTAETVIAEIGIDMKQFATAEHLASWAGMCPGNNESAGKRKSGRTTKGSRWLRQVLTQAAWAASHTKDTYLSSQYRRLAARRGKKRALVALGHTLLVVIYHLLKDGTKYHELGGDFLERLEPERLTRQLINRLEKLGHKVILQPKEDAA